MKKEFKYTQEGKESVAFVVKPTAKELGEAQLCASRTFAKLINDEDEHGNPTALVRSKLMEYMRKVGLWDDEKEQKLKDTQTQILEFEKVLAMGGIKFSAGKKVALEIRKLRGEQMELLSKKTELDAKTAEGMAENARFDYLASVCIKDQEGNRVFTSLDEYRERTQTEDWIYGAAFELAGLISTAIDTKWEHKLPENRFLLQYGFCDDKLRLINKDGHLVDSENRLINDEGRFVAYDSDNKQYFVDREGNQVDAEGNPIVEFVPFVED